MPTVQPVPWSKCTPRCWVFHSILWISCIFSGTRTLWRDYFSKSKNLKDYPTMSSLISWEMCVYCFQICAIEIMSLYSIRRDVQAWCSFHPTLETKNCDMEVEGICIVFGKYTGDPVTDCQAIWSNLALGMEGGYLVCKSWRFSLSVPLKGNEVGLGLGGKRISLSFQGLKSMEKDVVKGASHLWR